MCYKAQDRHLDLLTYKDAILMLNKIKVDRKEILMKFKFFIPRTLKKGKKKARFACCDAYCVNWV